MILVHSKQIHFLFHKYIYITTKEEKYALIKILLMCLNEES